MPSLMTNENVLCIMENIFLPNGAPCNACKWCCFIVWRFMVSIAYEYSYHNSSTSAETTYFCTKHQKPYSFYAKRSTVNNALHGHMTLSPKSPKACSHRIRQFTGVVFAGVSYSVLHQCRFLRHNVMGVYPKFGP